MRCACRSALGGERTLQVVLAFARQRGFGMAPENEVHQAPAP
jgi:hypothetical protein